MADLQKVIRGLECCVRSDDGRIMRCPETCPYDDDNGHLCETILKQDALELLRELEAIRK